MSLKGIGILRTLQQRPNCRGLQQQTRVAAAREKHVAPLQFAVFARTSSSKTNGNTAASIVESFQGGEHEFSSSRARENLSESIETGSFPNQGNSGRANGKSPTSAGKKEFRGTDSHVGKYDSQGTVSLHSVMQSNVPEPFQPKSKTGSAPTHLNMPGGGVKLRDKYLSEKRVKSTYDEMNTISKRKFSTSALYSSAEANIDFYSDIPCPQGVQGHEDCHNFKLWLDNCRKYGFSSCVEQLEGIQSGRKNLHQVFTEQEELIKQIAQNYYRYRPSSGDMQGVQGDIAMSQDGPDVQGLQGEIPPGGVDTLAMMSNPCPQGVQGDDCVQFKLWLQNCVQFGVGDCQQQLDDLRAGRRNLAQVFMEQEQLIRDVAMQYAAASQQPGSGPGGPGPEVSTPSGSTPPPPDPERKLSQRERLKRAVKEYGSTVVVFHVTISLMSLGGFYLAVSSGIDMIAILSKLGVGESVLESKALTGASTFVMAYAVHKVFAPARIAMTLTCTPLIVRYLRRVGFLKPPKLPKSTT